MDPELTLLTVILDKMKSNHSLLNKYEPKGYCKFNIQQGAYNTVEMVLSK